LETAEVAMPLAVMEDPVDGRSLLTVEATRAATPRRLPVILPRDTVVAAAATTPHPTVDTVSALLRLVAAARLTTVELVHVSALLRPVVLPP
jgi:hypothetical protein